MSWARPLTWRYPGGEDLRRAADDLAARLPSSLAPFARLAFNYRWSWTRGGHELFAAIHPHRWEACSRNPVRLLQEAPTVALERAATDRDLVARAYSLEECIAGEGSPAFDDGTARAGRPVAFLCAEYGLHVSLPIYAGGLGILAGDLLKAASDLGVPMVAVGLFYREGYFHQRFDVSGRQQEYWVDSDLSRLPCALVTSDGLEPLAVRVPIRGRDVVVQIWRVDVGRVPLYLLDADRPENGLVDRWITSRLYVSDRETRLAQYALLGLGGVRALRALRIEPAVLHLNEGHSVLGILELAAAEMDAGASFEEAVAAVRQRTVFTTHTPVSAGNEHFAAADVRRFLEGLAPRLGGDWERILALGGADGTGPQQLGLTELGLRMSRSCNGVSRRHGEVARSMWRPLFGARRDEDVPIGAVTNGVHLPTWMCGPVAELLRRHLGDDFERRSDAPETWERVEEIPDAEVWEARCRLRRGLVEAVRERATLDRLQRGEPNEYVELAARAFDPDRLTLGFARRLATYKRLHLIYHDPARALELLRGPKPVQILLAGKAHPADDGAKEVLRNLFDVRRAPRVGDRIAYLHDYDMRIAQLLVGGCDVWINLPRAPLEASGTSGMKAALNGGLNVSVLDGWWAEGYEPGHGWAIPGEAADDPGQQDARDAGAPMDILEKEVVPLFHDRDADGIPRGWVQRVKASIRTAGLRFTARRMVRDYATGAYAADSL